MFRVGKSPSDQHALSNCLAVNPRDFRPVTKHVKINGSFLFTLKTDPTMESGVIGFSQVQRNWMQLALGQEISVDPFDPDAASLIAAMKVRLDFLRKGQQASFEADKLAAHIASFYAEQLFTVGQPFIVEFAGHNLAARVEAVSHVDPRTVGMQISAAPWGLLMRDASITVQAEDGSQMRLDGGNASSQQALFQANFKFEDLGIGGLESEFVTIFRRAFSSRLFPATLIKTLGIQPVRGLMLHGPPGTGKTLIARQLGKMLNCHPPRIVNGPEILNKYVGQSEENVRALFADAEAEYKARGDASRLHLIIFDEIDAICRQRGSRADGTGVGDGIVNQLLSKLDGVQQLNNILVIGMTNRLDMIDEALLRPGRFEVHLEIGLPDEAGRQQILQIHTHTMQQHSRLAVDVDLAEIAGLTKNFTGAELTGLIKSAASFALMRHVKVGTLAAIEEDFDESRVVLCRDDFMRALSEVRASFGVDDEALEACAPYGIIPWGPAIDTVLSDGQLAVKDLAVNPHSRLSCLLLWGEPGSGRTSLAVRLARDSQAPLIKLLSVSSMLGLGEASKVQRITECFMDAYKSHQSVIIVDAIERLLEWVPMGPRFSNQLLQCLLTALLKDPPAQHRLLIIVTASDRNLMAQLGLLEAFSTQLYVPNLTEWSHLERVISSSSFPDPAGLLRELKGSFSSFSIPIKRLLDLLHLSAQDQENPIGKFLHQFSLFTQ